MTSQLQIVDLQRYACSASLYKTRRGCVQIFDLQSEAVLANRRFARVGFVRSRTTFGCLLRFACTASLYKTRRGCVQIFDLQSEAVLANRRFARVGFVRSLAQPTAVQLPAQQSCATAANRRFASKQPFDLQAIDGRGCLLRKAEQGGARHTLDELQLVRSLFGQLENPRSDSAL